VGKGNWMRAAGTALARTITISRSTTFHLPTKIVEPNPTTTATYVALYQWNLPERQKPGIPLINGIATVGLRISRECARVSLTVP
jgi:hypothetical protein